MSLARAMAKRSLHREFSVGAVVTRRGQVISVGTNSGEKTHPATRNRMRRVHAEVDAIIGIDRDQLRNGIAWVYRERIDGTLGSAKPCPDCQRLLTLAGIREAIYTDPDTGYGMMTL
jgi:deoxycytidylate deaminase